MSIRQFVDGRNGKAEKAGRFETSGSASRTGDCGTSGTGGTGGTGETSETSGTGGGRVERAFVRCLFFANFSLILRSSFAHPSLIVRSSFAYPSLIVRLTFGEGRGVMIKLELSFVIQKSFVHLPQV